MPEKLRTFIAYHKSGFVGGAEVYAEVLSAHLAELVEVVQVPLPRFKAGVYALSHVRGCFVLLKKAIKTKPSVLNVHSLAYPYAFAAALAKLLLKRPMVATLHGVPRGRLSRAAFRLAALLASRFCDAVVAPTEHSKSMLRREIAYGGMVEVVLPAPWLPNASCKACSSLEQLKERFAVLCVSRVSREKCLEAALDAVGGFLKAHEEAVLVIAGPVDDASYYEELLEKVRTLGLSDKVAFLGFIPRERMRSVYESCKVFFSPFLHGGVPLSVLEAMSLGLPVVALDNGDLRSVVKSGLNGFLVDPEKPEDAARALELLLNNDELRKKLGEHARATAGELSWEGVARAYLSLFEEVGGFAKAGP